MFESRNEKVLPPQKFFWRLVASLGVATGILVLALGAGAIGYHLIAGLAWVDSVYNAAMILTGMGPVDAMTGTGAKLFASIYALFSGVVFLTVMTVVLTPVAHRLLHKFHVDEPDEADDRD